MSDVAYSQNCTGSVAVEPAAHPRFYYEGQHDLGGGQGICVISACSSNIEGLLYTENNLSAEERLSPLVGNFTLKQNYNFILMKIALFQNNK